MRQINAIGLQHVKKAVLAIMATSAAGAALFCLVIYFESRLLGGWAGFYITTTLAVHAIDLLLTGGLLLFLLKFKKSFGLILLSCYLIGSRLWIFSDAMHGSSLDVGNVRAANLMIYALISIVSILGSFYILAQYKYRSR